MPFKLIWEPRGVVRRYLGDVTIAERLARRGGAGWPSGISLGGRATWRRFAFAINHQRGALA